VAEDEHIIEAVGRCRITIRNGSVVDVGEPRISRCPLAKRFSYPVDAITREAVRANIEHRIRSFGMCTPDRNVLADRDFVLFGASELLSSAVRQGLLDCAVLACDGAGSVVASRPELIQGIGGRMSGLVSTSPIPEVIRRIEENGGDVLDPDTAAIDQVKGVFFAASRGYNRIAVTTASGKEAKEIRTRYPPALIFGVHLTGVTEEEARELVEACDLVSVCASHWMRETAGKRSLLQAGRSIPTFAMTKAGKKVLLAKIGETDQQVFMQAAALPIIGEKSPYPLTRD
jgi:putative methanogenesis marker protein 8